LPAPVLALLLLAACAPRLAPGGPGLDAEDPAPGLTRDALITHDGLRLPVRRWTPDGEVKLIVLALHGFNDYSNAFENAGSYLAARGILTVAYDQRGFGEAPHRGRWAGVEAMTADVGTAARSLSELYPGLPTYLLGDSMGGAVVLAALAGDDPPPADGIVLAAAAVWGRETMPWYQRAALWLGAHTVPWGNVSGRGLDIQASDNIEMLRALGRDPLVIKQTRVDAVYGLVNLMDAALASAPNVRLPALLLYGEKDEIIPMEPTLAFWRDIPRTDDVPQRMALYETGWHMLLRDLQAEIVLADVAHWVRRPDLPLPSGADRKAEETLAANAEP
jgi:alpha-beta hydrolase superfamily lysophospholipase